MHRLYVAYLRRRARRETRRIMKDARRELKTTPTPAATTD